MNRSGWPGKWFGAIFNRDNPNVQLARWSFLHAVLMLFGAVCSWTTGVFWVLVAPAALSFAFLIALVRPFWTARGGFGSANCMTSIRLIGVLALPFFGSAKGVEFTTGWGLLLWATDFLDGWLARRYNQTSEFGEYFDKETDALFMLILCNIAVLKKRLWHGFMIQGLLRYIFVVLLPFCKTSRLKEEKTTRAKTIYGFVMLVLLGSFTPYLELFRFLAVPAALVLLISFSIDFYRGCH